MQQIKVLSAIVCFMMLAGCSAESDSKSPDDEFFEEGSIESQSDGESAPEPSEEESPHIPNRTSTQPFEDPQLRYEGTWSVDLQAGAGPTVSNNVTWPIFYITVNDSSPGTESLTKWRLTAIVTNGTATSHWRLSLFDDSTCTYTCEEVFVTEVSGDSVVAEFPRDKFGYREEYGISIKPAPAGALVGFVVEIVLQLV